MIKNKKFLFFITLTNCLFFLAVGLIISREIDNRKQDPLQTWLASALIKTAPAIHLRRTKTKEQMQMVLNTPDTLFKKKLADSFNIVAILERKNDLLLELYGSKEKSPHPIELYEKNTIAAYSQREDLYFTYFYREGEKDSKNQLSVVLQRPISRIIEAVDLIGIDISILEEARGEKSIVYSSMPDDAANEFLKTVDFQKLENQELESVQELVKNIYEVTLGKQRYLVILVDLVFTEKFKQKIAYSLLIPDYETVSISSFSLLVVVLFFIITLLSFWMWIREKD
jgi:hypothetical protein